MKVKVTITGTIEVEAADVKLLKDASAGEVMDTMRYQATGLTATIVPLAEEPMVEERPPTPRRKRKA